MNMSGIKALTFDTGGTILDWHTGVRDTLARLGSKHGIDGDWPTLANEFRRRSLGTMLNHGEHTPATKNFDDVHRETIEAMCSEFGLDAFTDDDRREVWWDTMHNLTCWQDFPAVLPQLRTQYLVASFTILSFRIIMDTARKNGLSWDAVISCEAIGKYKVLPEAYNGCARFLQLDPGEICMVACHGFDLDAARSCGFKTALVNRPDEWGPAGPPKPASTPDYDIMVDSFPELAAKLGVST